MGLELDPLYPPRCVAQPLRSEMGLELDPLYPPCCVAQPWGREMGLKLELGLDLVFQFIFHHLWLLLSFLFLGITLVILRSPELLICYLR